MNKIIFLKVQREYIKEFYDASLKYLGYIPDDKYLKRQLLFLGYQPESKVKMRSKFAYFMTNRMLEGEYFVYPERFCDNYKTLKNGKYKFYEQNMGLYGIPGITKIRYGRN